MFAQVAVNSYTQSPRQLFTYAIPPVLVESVQVGCRVLVPFGPRALTGVVLEIVSESDQEGIKPILSCLDSVPQITAHQLALANWLSHEYHASLKSCLDTVHPFLFRQTPVKRQVRIAVLKRDKACSPDLKIPDRQQAVVDIFLNAFGLEIPVETLLSTFHSSPSTLKTMSAKGLIDIIERDEVEACIIHSQPEARLIPTPPQQLAIDRLADDVRAQNGTVFVLHGVTGSGKTEVYLHAIARTLEENRQAVLLVPEIALTPQTIERVLRRFPGLVKVWHSRLSDRERHRTFEHVRSGQTPIVVGSRSALFLPYPDLGFIAIDEEHEISYKQESNPRYDARRVAVFLGNQLKATVVFGSATPSVETFYQTQQGTFKLLELPDRIHHLGSGAAPMGKRDIRIVDLRVEMKAGNRTTLSLDLQNELTATLERGEQAILFLNRRGFSTYVFCRECGHVLMCPACEIPLTLHQLGAQRSKLICHHCGRYEQPPECCPKCQGTKIKYLGAGTQQVVDDVAKLFPQARILRVDADSTGAVDSFQQVHDKITGHKVDIIIGTQMIAKGWDIPAVSLVGVILADQSLFFPSFRAGERTFQLLTQVAGRSGRRTDPGRVIIQTYSPDNSYILAARDEAYDRFFDAEIKSREAFNYPPFARFVKLTIHHTDEAKAVELCEDLIEILDEKKEGTGILGPVPAFILKKKDRYFYHVILQGQNPLPLLQYVPREWTVDVDPIDLL